MSLPLPALILLALLGLIVLGGLTLFIISRRRPNWLLPIGALLMRSKFVRKRVVEQTVQELGENPEISEDLLAGQSRQVRRRAQQQLGRQQDFEKKQLLDKAARGEAVGPNDLRRGRSAEETRAAAERKEASREKQRRARKQRKASRPKRKKRR